jgi:hypothetical protein
MKKPLQILLESESLFLGIKISSIAEAEKKHIAIGGDTNKAFDKQIPSLVI